MRAGLSFRESKANWCVQRLPSILLTRLGRASLTRCVYAMERCSIWLTQISDVPVPRLRTPNQAPIFIAGVLSFNADQCLGSAILFCALGGVMVSIAKSSYYHLVSSSRARL